MSDHISREALIGKVEKHYCAPCKGQGGDLDGDWCRSCVINSVLEKIREFPAADVAEVVRCCNCEFHDHDGTSGYCNYWRRWSNMSDFCSRGK